jgi:hypothetical protein
MLQVIYLMHLMLLNKSCEAGTNIYSLFYIKIHLPTNGLIMTYAPQVGYFTAPQQVSILAH